MKYYIILFFAIALNSALTAQTIDPEKDSLYLVPSNQIGFTAGMGGYEVSFMATYKRAHLKSSIGTEAGINMGYWYYGFIHSKNFYDASRSSLELVAIYDSLSVYRANSEFEKYYGFQFGRSREIRSCDRASFSGFQFSFDYYIFANYGERSFRYYDEYLTFETAPSTTYMGLNDLPQVPVSGERKIMSVNAGIGAMMGLDMVFGTGDGKKGNKRNIIVGFKYGVPNFGVDVPFGEKSISDPSGVYTNPVDNISLTFYHQVLFKFGYAF